MQHVLRFLPALCGLAFMLISQRADAGGRGGGGRLGAVSRGVGSATGSRGSGSHGSHGHGAGHGSHGVSGGHGATASSGHRGHHHHVPFYPGILGASEGGGGPTEPPSLKLYLGTQKVVGSDGSVSVEGALTAGRLRLGGTVTQYFESQAPPDTSTPMLRVTIPTVTAGLRLDGGGPSRVFLEGGAAWLTTSNDPTKDSSVGGIVAGLHVEQVLGPRLALVGDARAMLFTDNISGREARLGVQISYVRASFRVLDLNVGPALYGPEIGLGVRF